MRRLALPLSLALLAAPALVPPAPAATQASIFEWVGSSMAGTDLSARAAGMGGAAGAVFWGDALDARLNPALLGLARGVRYDDDRLSFGFAAVARRTTLGAYGVGVALEGEPFAGLGKRELAMQVDFSDPYGGSGSFRSYDRVRSWAGGASLATLVSAFAQSRGRAAPGWARYADLTASDAENVGEVGLEAPSEAFRFRRVTRDAGMLARLGASPAAGPFTPSRVDAAYGYSVLGLRGHSVDGTRVERHARHAVAARAEWATPRAWARALPAWAAAALEPGVTLGAAYDWEREPSLFDSRHVLTTAHSGVELGLTRVLSLQLGRQDTGGNSTSRRGWAVTLPAGRFGGARYARARVPDLDTTYRSWSVWIDPLAIARR